MSGIMGSSSSRLDLTGWTRLDWTGLIWTGRRQRALSVSSTKGRCPFSFILHVGLTCLSVLHSWDISVGRRWEKREWLNPYEERLNFLLLLPAIGQRRCITNTDTDTMTAIPLLLLWTGRSVDGDGDGEGRWKLELIWFKRDWIGARWNVLLITANSVPFATPSCSATLLLWTSVRRRWREMNGSESPSKLKLNGSEADRSGARGWVLFSFPTFRCDIRDRQRHKLPLRHPIE